MKILIELPSWLGDTVMTTPTIENLVNFFDDTTITILGSSTSVEVYQYHPNVIETRVLDKKIKNLYKEAKNLGEFDLFFSFRGSLRSKFLKFIISAKSKYQYNKNRDHGKHQVEKYINFVNESLNSSLLADKLIVYSNKKHKVSKRKLLGINPGASYGSAKRWYPKKFARVAVELSSDYDIIIFGGHKEIDIAFDIESYLIAKGVQNFRNLVGQTSLEDLIVHISNLDLFLTGDSGPMHLAAAFQIPTVTIFGPTIIHETAQWMNEKSAIVVKNLDCQPCMEKSCPLKHHNCMKLIRPSEVLKEIEKVVSY